MIMVLVLVLILVVVFGLEEAELLEGFLSSSSSALVIKIKTEKKMMIAKKNVPIFFIIIYLKIQNQEVFVLADELEPVVLVVVWVVT